ncbi:hypothetical protein QZH41_017985 [Actinostola sp. cb2023]|nr:hypothetical protein QZH41_017985 [Actinostola sp. cb2023]
MATNEEEKIVKDMPQEMKDKQKWYGDAKDYWKEPEAVKKQKKDFIQPKTQARIALDCGAGIGRVAKYLLIPLFETVDMLEQNKHFLDQCDQYLGDLRSKVQNLYPIGLQEFDPVPSRYDVIWCQWVMGHLTDDDFIAFLNLCKKGLNDGGILCIKENIATRQDYDVDVVDSSVTRSHKQYTKLFEKSKMKLIMRETQTNFPSEIYKVNM